MKKRYPRTRYPIPEKFKRHQRVYDRYTYDKGKVVAGGNSTAKHVHVRFKGRLKIYGWYEVSVQRLKRYKKKED